MNNAIIQKQEDWVNTIVESAIVWLPIVAPLLNAVLVGNELLTQVLPMDSLIVKVIVTILAAIVLEFSGMMFISFIAKAENYNLTRQDKAPGISVWWGWLAVAAYLIMSFFMYYFSTIAPALARYMGHDTSARELAPISVVFFLPIIFFVFKLHRDSSVMRTVQTAVDSLRRAKADQRRIELEIERTEMEFDKERTEMELNRQQAEIELERQRADVEMQRAKADAVRLKAEAKVATVKPLETLTTVSKESAQSEMRRLLAENPTISNRDLAKALTEFGYKISHVSISKWKGSLENAN